MELREDYKPIRGRRVLDASQPGSSPGYLNDVAQGSAGRLGCRRLEGYPAAHGCRQNAECREACQKRRRGSNRHASPTALADAVDFHRYRKAAVQTRHPRLHGAGAGWKRRAADHESLAEIESAVEHPQPERSAQRGDRMVAQPSRGTDQRRDGFRPLSPRHAVRSTRAGRCRRIRFIRRNWPRCLAGLRMHPDLITPEMVEPFIPLAKEIDQDEDKRLALFLRTLAECMSIQSAAVWLLDNEPWDFFAVYFEAIDHFCHGFMRYYPPRQPWIGRPRLRALPQRGLEGVRAP